MDKQQIEGLLAKLNTRERQVLIERYGLRDGIGKTYQEVARTYGVTAPRIKQIERKALARLRHPRRKDAGAEFADLLEDQLQSFDMEIKWPWLEKKGSGEGHGKTSKESIQ